MAYSTNSTKKTAGLVIVTLAWILVTNAAKYTSIYAVQMNQIASKSDIKPATPNGNGLKWNRYRPKMVEQKKDECIERYWKDMQNFISLVIPFDFKSSRPINGIVEVSKEEYKLNIDSIYYTYIRLPTNVELDREDIGSEENSLAELLAATREINVQKICIFSEHMNYKSKRSVHLGIIYLIISKLRGCEYIYIQNIPNIVYDERYSSIINPSSNPIIDGTLSNIKVQMHYEDSNNSVQMLIENIFSPYILKVGELRIFGLKEELYTNQFIEYMKENGWIHHKKCRQSIAFSPTDQPNNKKNAKEKLTIFQKFIRYLG
ncbi:hypothetical protein NEFER03_1940 [Nematocida sp. LUAm3]|nr:hypothetical protein NEFER03_1940 [Nematocida sp. LUAm3]KAI5176158.1 hypothetical protein NEFER02_1972 [Nematocida sp. LUAm2]KAI5179452.1 hypothetical protein NEFER01_2261 [Nematocida sp. LUAm1]